MGKKKADTTRDIVVRTTKDSIFHVLLASIESYGGILFDDKSSDTIKTNSKFLKNTSIKDIVFEDISNTDKFIMKNKETGESIKISNRMSSIGEFRGQIFRDYIANEATHNPNMTAYDAIMKRIKYPQNSDVINAERRQVTGDYMRDSCSVEPMSEEHFNLFIQVLTSKIEEKMQEGINYEDKTNQSYIWSEINVEEIYDLTEQFIHHLNELEQKAKQLPESKASEVNELCTQLNQKKDDFIKGTISRQQFKKECTALIDNAQNGKLAEFRGIFGTIFSRIQKLLNSITFGLVQQPHTDSIQKTLKIKESLNALKDPPQSNSSQQLQQQEESLQQQNP